jgi:TrbC/VIRB2 pilin
MSLLTFMQNIATFIVGQFGIGAITVAIGLTAICAAYEICRWKRVGEAIVGGAILFSSGWIVTTWLGG